MAKRLDDIVRAPRRLQILIGPETLDFYMLEDEMKPADIRFALLESLKKQGYERIIFYGSGESPYCLDRESYDRVELKNDLINPDDETSSEEICQRLAATGKIQSGPLGSTNFLKERQVVGGNGETNQKRGSSVIAARVGRSGNIQSIPRSPLPDAPYPKKKGKSSELSLLSRDGGVGEVHAFSYVMGLLGDSTIKTAAVFVHAENLFSKLEAPAVIEDYLSRWMLPTQTDNSAFLIFNSVGENPEESTTRTANSIWQTHILRDAITTTKETPYFGRHFIQCPDEDELYSLLTFYGTELNSKDTVRMVRLMLMENQPLYYWVQMMKRLPGRTRDLTIEYARSQMWFPSIENPMMAARDQLESMVGLEPIKERIHQLDAYIGVHKRIPPLEHLILTGNPGTGKTSVARLLGEIYSEMGILKRGHVIEVYPGDLISDHVGGTALKVIEMFKKAKGGILFLDEAYVLTENDRGAFGNEAVDTLSYLMEDQKAITDPTQRVIVIAAGYKDKMELFRKGTPGFPSRFPESNCIDFPDFPANDLFKIFLGQLLAAGIRIVTKDFAYSAYQVITSMYYARTNEFGNAREMRSLVEDLERIRTTRLYDTSQSKNSPMELEDLKKSTMGNKFFKEDIMDLNALQTSLSKYVGLDKIKEYLIEKLVSITGIKKVIEANRPDDGNSVLSVKEVDVSRYSNIPSLNTELENIVLLGPTGTGKTLIAHEISSLYHKLGVLPSDKVIAAKISDITAQYVGHTIRNVKDLFAKAVGGVLFIDEFYALATNEFAPEALHTINQCISDYEGKVLVIIGGYAKETMQALRMNSGLPGRFQRYFELSPYTPDQLVKIFEKIASGAFPQQYSRSPLTVDPAARQSLQSLFERYAGDTPIDGNGRCASNVFKAAVTNLNRRMAEYSIQQIRADKSLATRIIAADIPDYIPSLNTVRT